MAISDNNDLFRNREPLMTVQEVADFLRVGKGSIRRWTREGRLKGYRLGGIGDWRYTRENVVNFIKGCLKTTLKVYF